MFNQLWYLQRHRQAMCHSANSSSFLQAAHYWEVPGLSAGGDWKSDRFQQEVIAYINTGRSQDRPATKDQAGQAAPQRADPILISIPELQNGADVYIITVGAGGAANNPNYPAKIQTIKDTIKGPNALGANTVFHDQFYRRPPDNQGVRVLFEYDPDGPGRVRLWYEDGLVFDRTRNAGGHAGWSLPARR
ncbi:MAG: hypothetical protein Q9160_007589 [Pyrenula sp. 1 TL-2023]